MIEILVVKGFLPDTARNLKNRFAQSMKKLVEDMVTKHADELVGFEVRNGEAWIRTKSDETLKFVEEQFKAMTGVQVTSRNAIQVERERNQAAQSKADRMRATRRANAGIVAEK